MVERPKKALPKKKGKKPEEAKQRSLLDMFPTKAIKAPTVIALESSSDIVDTPVTENEGSSSSAVLVDDSDSREVEVVPNEVKQPKLSVLSELSHTGPEPQPCEAQTPLIPRISLPTTAAVAEVPLAPLIALVQNVEGTTPSKPIVIDSSPVKELTMKAPPKYGVVHPFFVPRASTTKQKAPQIPRKSKSVVPQTWTVPYPDRDSQHVRGQQTLLPPFPGEAPRRRSSGRRSTFDIQATADYAFLVTGQPNRTSIQGYIAPSVSQQETGLSESMQGYASTIPEEHLVQHPSISKLVTRSLSGDLPQSASGRVLAEKWRPRCAEEVLGNEMSAQYLRNWLRALALQLEDSSSNSVPNVQEPTNRNSRSAAKKSKKRPRIIREVASARQRKRARTESDEEDDNWIVEDEEDDEEEEDAYSSSYHWSDNDSEQQLTASSPIASTSSLPDTGPELPTNQLAEPPHDLGELHNTILLVGPPGSGKTASVYACAEELGWEVFEVYPGIGRRNGSSIENLVGEVGKNHLVRQKPHGRHDFFPFGSPSKRKQGLNLFKSDPTSGYARNSVPLIDSEVEDIECNQPPSLAQSLILLEEVDILFKEDVRFWESVRDVIRECKRPIICTCNDISLVPVDDLPLQRVLAFEACPSEILASYLQGICCAEGRSIDRMVLERCIVSREERDSDHRAGLEHVSDLRRAIHNLDLSLSTGFPQASAESHLSEPTLFDPGPGIRSPSIPTSNASTKEEVLAQLRRAAYDAEIASCLDSDLSRNSLDRPAAIEVESSGPTNDDELGHPVLNDTRLDASLPSTYTRDMEIRTIISDRMRPGLVVDAVIREERKLEREKGKFLDHCYAVLKDVCPARVWGVGAAHLFTDYTPFIKQVAEAEDAQAVALVQQAQERRGRQTRNSAMSAFYRTLNLSEEGREGLWAICFSDLGT